MDGLYEQFRIALHQVWQRRWLALGVAWGLCLVGWLAVALIPNSYESKAKVFVQMQSILPSQAVINSADRQNDLTRIKQTLTSTANLEKVVRRTELNSLVASERDLAAQVAKLRETIKVTAQQDNLFDISATASISGFSNRQNAKASAAIVQTLLDLFVGGNLAGDRDATGQALTFLDAQLRDREVKLREAEQRRVDFEQRYMGLLPGEGSLSQRMTAARMELSGVEQQLMAANGSLGALRGQLGSTPASIETPGFGGGVAVGGAASQVAALEGQLAQSLARGWTDQHPDVAATRAQIERLRPAAARERSTGGTRAISTPNPAYVSLRSMVAEKEAQASAAQMRKSQLQAEMGQLAASQSSEPGIVAEQERLNRDYDVLKRQYDKLLEDREQVRLRSDVQNSNTAVQFKVIDPPSQPVVPASPNRPILLTVILLFASGAGIAAAFAKAQLQTTFPNQNRLAQATGLPVLGSISEIVSAATKLRERKRLVWLGGAGGALVGSYALLMLVEFWQRSTVA